MDPGAEIWQIKDKWWQNENYFTEKSRIIAFHVIEGSAQIVTCYRSHAGTQQAQPVYYNAKYTSDLTNGLYLCVYVRVFVCVQF